MEDQNNYDINSNNSFPQIQGNAEFIQTNLAGNYPQEANNPFQKKDEPEKEKKQKILLHGQNPIIPYKYSTTTFSSNIGRQGAFDPKYYITLKPMILCRIHKTTN